MRHLTKKGMYEKKTSPVLSSHNLHTMNLAIPVGPPVARVYGKNTNNDYTSVVLDNCTSTLIPDVEVSPLARDAVRPLKNIVDGPSIELRLRKIKACQMFRDGPILESRD